MARRRARYRSWPSRRRRAVTPGLKPRRRSSRRQHPRASGVARPRPRTGTTTRCRNPGRIGWSHPGQMYALSPDTSRTSTRRRPAPRRARSDGRAEPGTRGALRSRRFFRGIYVWSRTNEARRAERARPRPRARRPSGTARTSGPPPRTARTSLGHPASARTGSSVSDLREGILRAVEEEHRASRCRTGARRVAARTGRARGAGSPGRRGAAAGIPSAAAIEAIRPP